MIDKLEAWLCLKSAPELGQKGTLALLKQFPDPQEFVGNPQHEVYDLSALKPASKEHLLKASLPEAMQKSLVLKDDQGIDFVCLGDSNYPATLQKIANPPLILYYKGDLGKALQGINLAVVGTRKPSFYGGQMCRKLLKPVCEKGVCVISGLAVGIDTIAHQTALAVGGKTIGVLASGLDQIYPPSNKELAARICENGALVSEYEPGSELERWNFPDRNRIISALSQAVLIIEGAIDSGAMLTAKFAKEQGKPLYALPGNINNHNAAGPNLLIRQGATLLGSADDLLHDLGLGNDEPEQLEILTVLNIDEQVLYDLLAAEQREMSFDEFILSTGFGFGKLSSVLLSLELKGLIARSSGNSFLKL
ncbi:DNA-processing protein DprA [Candidatus Cloacimonadaceae bacterium]